MRKDSIEFLDHIPQGCDSTPKALFYSHEYLDLTDTQIASFCARNKSSNSLLAVIHFQIIDEQAVSLRDAPFGGLQSEPSTDSSILSDFLNFVVLKLTQRSLSHALIKSPPLFYKNTCHDHQIFKSSGFKATTLEINHHLKISSENMSLRLAPMQKRRLNKCIQAGFVFKQEESTALPKVYQFIKECREEKRQGVSVSLNKLLKSVEKMPDRYLMFSCYDKDVLIAASICVAVTEKLLYNFLPSSKISYNDYSPMVYMIERLYKYCQDNNFETLDLGTSMLDGQRNESLATFKSRVGALATERTIFSLKA